MSEHRSPPPPTSSRSAPDDRNNYQFRNSAFNKYRKFKQPCLKFGSIYGCPYGDKCHYSHEFQAIYPAYHEIFGYYDPFWSNVYAMSRQTHQNYLQRPISRVVKNPSMSESKSVRHSSSSFSPSKDERTNSFVNHWNKDSQPEDIRVRRENLELKEAVFKQIKLKKSDRYQRESAELNITDEHGYSDDNNYNNFQESDGEGNKGDAKHQAQQTEQPMSTFPRKCAANDGILNPATDHKCAGRDQQQPRIRSYPCQFSLNASQQVQTLGPSYTQHLAEEQFYRYSPQSLRSIFYNNGLSWPLSCSYSSNLSGQVEACIDSIDAALVSMEKHQQRAISSMQELVRSLWPDAFIEIYGSSYTRLALPSSDIDCVLVANSLAEEQPLVILEALAAEVERQPWTKYIEVLGSAKIPVLKVTYSLELTKQDVLLDLTCGHSVGHTGLGARDLVCSMLLKMPALRPLVLILKSHLVSISLNCAFSGGLSSYVLVLLVIRFLQACGDTHTRSYSRYADGRFQIGNRRRSYSENECVSGLPEEFVPTSSLRFSLTVAKPRWCYTFSRGGGVTWHTSIGSLLMLFLETYITFDYRRFGISIENKGVFFVLPPDKVAPLQCSVVVPYVADPMKPGRSICNCFRMHEVIQSWLALYQNLAAGVPIATCIGQDASP
ncbi:putative Zinc finger, CCCH-type, polymerase, nucleotidyl transferase domain-containing protein [Plasmopara halstedii]